MEADNGRLNFVPRIENGPMRQDAEETKNILRGIGTSSEEVGRYSDEALSRATMSAYGRSKRMSEEVAAANAKAKKSVTDSVNEAEKQMDRLQAAFQKGYNYEGTVEEFKKKIKVQTAYLKDAEQQYKQTEKALKTATPGREWMEVTNSLNKQKKTVAETKEELKGLKQKYDELSANSFTSLRTRMMNITNQMAQMRLEGKQNTDEYKKLVNELGKLASVQREINQGKLFDSTSGTQIQGIMQGVQALMGAYTAFNGVASIFVEDEQKLVKIQTQLQATMSVLMGLNSIATALHHTSAFRLRTLAALQNMWTVATKATTVAMSLLKKAIVSTGIGILVTGVGMLVSKLMDLNKRSKEAKERTNELREALAQASGEAGKQVSQLNAYANALKNVNLSKREEWDIIKKLNSRYGDLFGKYYTKEDWLKKLTEKTKEYTAAIIAQKTAEQAAARIAENIAKRDEVRQKMDEFGKKDKNIQNLKNSVANTKAFVEVPEEDGLIKQMYKQRVKKENPLLSEEDVDNKALEAATEDLKTYEAQLKKTLESKRQYRKLQEEESRYTAVIDKDTKTLNDATVAGLTTGLGGNAQEEAKQADDLAKARQDGWNKVYNAEIAAMEDGYARSKAQLEEQHRQTMQQIDREEKDLAKKLKEQGKGGLSEDDKNRFEGLRTAEINKYLKEKKKLEENHQKELESLYKQTSAAFMTTQQKEINAIKDKYAEMRRQLDQQKKGGAIGSELHVSLVANVDRAESAEMMKYWIEAYGNYDQKRKALDEQWRTDLKDVPPEFAAEAQRQMTEALSKLDFEQFKKTIDWAGVFGDLEKQSSEAIKYNLSQIQAYFDANKLDMGVDEIKDLQQAIKSMTDELEGRNPLAGLINAIHDIGAAKSQAVEAINAIKEANDELNAAKEEQRLAEEEVAMYENETDAEGETEIAEAKAAAQNRLTAAIQGVAAAEAKKTQAEQKGVTASNKMAASYRKVTSNMQSVKGVISGVANDAKNLAAVFSDEVADGVGKAVDLMETVIDSATSVIDVVADTGKRVGESITGTVQASSTAMQATSMAAATSISTVEKASVILTVISAALQVATAIASLFDGDKKKDEQIESLQNRIDQLQWEIDNADIMRLKADNQGKSALAMTYEAIGKTIKEMDRARQSWIDWKATTDTGVVVLNTEAVKKSADELNKAYVNVGYSAGKAFGDDFWNQAGESARKYAEDVVYLQQQLAQEKGKKKKDEEKIQELENQIEETGAKIKETYDKLIEDIIGGSYQDIADQLGDAFIEAFQNGEDAAAAWGEAVDKIVADVIKKMFIQQFLTQRISDVFAKYQDKWLDENGNTSYDKVMASMEDFGNDLKKAGDDFSEEWQELMKNDYFKELFGGDATRTASEKGIQSISQDSADEMNGRLTAMQSHTYLISESVKLLVQNSAAILLSVLEIQDNTERIYRQMAGLEQEMSETRAGISAISRGFRKIA